MIRKVHFKNFRCLRDVELLLEPLTVLVGPNSSGKTTVLEGLQPRHGFLDADLWRQEKSVSVSIEWLYADGLTADIRRTPASQSHLHAQFSPRTGRTATHGYQPVALDLEALRRENVLAIARRLSSNGDNLANVFYSLGRKQQADIAKELCRLVPMFSDVDLQPTDSGRHRLRFQDRWASDLWFTPERVSDGTMLLLAFIVLQHQDPAPDLITIEEPERALHPYLLDELIQMLRKMTTGEIGKTPVQVVLATHSAELLDYVRPEEVRFLTRSQEDGSVQVNQAPPDTTHWRRVYEEYNQSLGSIWLSGGMGGVPGA
ncbi:AAA family ATPase [Archangium sp.]|uniref:AAA family ATPase n=1 Tax=Archangium sp. TaxID=1872627 RepID=UPI002D2209C5|nr:AAA family ATPase [Archangium sp.]HYO55006.1 AAA family ATPase [Archangium sp.]